MRDEVKSLIFKNLFVVKQQIAFTGQNIIDCCRHYLMIVATEPLVFILTNVGRVMSGFNRSNVVDDSKECVSVATRNITVIIT